MNARSRVPGKGAKRSKPKRKSPIVRTLDEMSRPSKQAPNPDLEPPLSNTQIREKILEGLAQASPAALRALVASVGQCGRAERGSGQRSSDAKWMLDRLFELIAAPEQGSGDANQAGGATGVAGEVVSLAERRTELRELLRQQRREMNK